MTTMARRRIPGEDPRRWRSTGMATLIGAFALTACDLTDPDDTRRTLEVAPHQVVCSGLGYGLCLQVREPGSTTWESTFDYPEGFSFEWGVATRIVVEERELDPPPFDGSAIRLTLVRVVDRRTDPADSLFSLRLPGATTISPEAGRFQFASAAFRCDTGPDCDGLATALGGDDAVEVTLVLGASATDPFRVVDWRACGAAWPACPGFP